MNRRHEIIRFALYALVVVLLNIALQTVFFRIDLTANNTYSLTRASRSMVSELEEPLTIKVYITENLPQPYNNLEQTIRDTLQEYSLAGNKNFNYDIYLIKNLDEEKAESSNDFEQDARGYGINPIQIQQVDQSEINLTSAYMGAAFIHADMIETVPVINPNENFEYLITSTVMKMQEKTSKLLSLEDDIHLKLYLSSSIFGLAGELRTYPEQLEAVADSLNKTNYNRISYEWIDPDGQPVPETEDYGFSAFSFKDDFGRVNKYYASAVIEYGDNFTSFDVLSRGLFGYSIQDPAEIEDQLNGVVERLIGIGNKIVWLTGHGTISPYSSQQQQYGEPTVASVMNLISSRYSIKTADLSTELLPDDAGSMIIARPQPFMPYTDWELYQIDQFLMKGGNVAVFMDGFMEYLPQQQGMQMQQQAPVYIPRSTGLEKLLEHYGVSVEQSYVMDENCFHQQQQSAQGIMDIPVYFAPQIKPEKINEEIPYMQGIKGLITLNNSPVKISEELPEGRTASVLFSSSDDSWIVDDPQQINLYNPMMIFPPGEEEKGSYPLAAVVEGSFTSYFADKGVPEMPEPAEDNSADGEAGADTEEYLIEMDRVSREENMINSTDNGKLFVFGSSMAISDSLVDQNGTSTNSVLIMNIIDEMNGNGDFSLMRKKGLNYNPLDETEPGLKTFVKTFNMAVIPGLVILAGLLVWFRWHRRQRRIAAMFMEADNE